MHWADELIEKVIEFVRDRGDLVVSSGLSVSGLQHVGRLRGEVVLGNTIARALQEEGHPTQHVLVLYTQDQWKASPRQVAEFADGSGATYASRRLIDVPDPHGCHPGWVDHYWEDFGDHLEDFARGVRVVRTSDIYTWPEMKAVVEDLAGRSEEVREVVNRFRARHPYPPGWLPFEPLCLRCKRIGKARAVKVNDRTSVAYECECGDRGESPIEKGKLNWRLEWPALWKVLDVDVEPFGKDHATPGGSRDSCKEVAKVILGIEPPFGIPYEWVGIAEKGVDLGDMDSSDFKGFWPGDWLRVADAEVLRYIYLVNPVGRRIVLDLGKMDVYHDAFDAAERSFYAMQRSEDEEVQARSYELAQLDPQPMEAPFQLSYRHAAFLHQISPPANRLEWCLARLKDTGILTRRLSDFDVDRVRRRLEQGGVWVEKYAPENKVVLLERLPTEVLVLLTPEDREALRTFASKAESTEWREDAIKGLMVALTKGGALPVDTPRFFRDLYLVLLGEEKGPRAAPFLAVLDKKFVLRRLLEVGR
jgi:lysyl-tRNA synthetase class 1